MEGKSRDAGSEVSVTDNATLQKAAGSRNEVCSLLKGKVLLRCLCYRSREIPFDGIKVH
jgi:hypothetical protein